MQGPREIALVEKEGSCIRGFADLKDVVPISYSEFVRWHQDAVRSDVPLSAMPASTTCFSYVLENLKVLDVPSTVDVGESHMWIDLPDDAEP